MENSELKTSKFDQCTSEFDQNASEKISEVFVFQFSVLGTVQNGKLGVEKSRENVLRGFRDFRVFDLTGFEQPFHSNVEEMHKTT